MQLAACPRQSEGQPSERHVKAPTPSNNTPKPRENGIPAKANIVLSWLKGRKSSLF